MTIVAAHLTNKAYGFPTRGAQRRVKAPILACIHITGNRRTAAYTDRHQAALDERSYANRVGSPGPSAHYYVARDGWAIGAIDPSVYAAWSNGDVASPNSANAGIAKVLALRAKGYNANEAYWLEFECVGYGSTYPITVAQKQFCATRIAAMAKVTGQPVNRATVHGHSDLNSVNRASCPSPRTSREAFLADVIARANAILVPPTTTVTVEAGDTLGAIASAHGLTLEALLAFSENAKYRANPGLIQKAMPDVVMTLRMLGRTAGTGGMDRWVLAELALCLALLDDPGRSGPTAEIRRQGRAETFQEFREYIRTRRLSNSETHVLAADLAARMKSLGPDLARVFGAVV
ncbi:MAG: LysM domain-containing protein [Chloroflexota bacterium]